MKFLRRIQSAVGLISVVLFSVEIVLVLFQILSRNFTGRSYAAVEEFVVTLLPYFAMFAAVYTMYNGNHVQIDFLYNKLPAAVRRVLFITLQAAMIITVGILVYGSWMLTVKQWGILSPALQWPNGIKYFCFVLTGPFMAPLFVYNIIQATRKELDDSQGLPETGAEIISEEGVD